MRKRQPKADSLRIFISRHFSAKIDSMSKSSFSFFLPSFVIVQRLRRRRLWRSRLWQRRRSWRRRRRYRWPRLRIASRFFTGVLDAERFLLPGQTRLSTFEILNDASSILIKLRTDLLFEVINFCVYICFLAANKPFTNCPFNVSRSKTYLKQKQYGRFLVGYRPGGISFEVSFANQRSIFSNPNL